MNFAKYRNYNYGDSFNYGDEEKGPGSNGTDLRCKHNIDNRSRSREPGEKRFKTGSAQGNTAENAASSQVTAL